MAGRLNRGENVQQYEGVILRKDGERVHVQVSWFPIRNGAGEVTATAAIVHDITGRRRVEQARRDGAESFRTAFEHAPFGMCLSTPDSRLMRVNTTFCRMLGYTEDELIERGWMAITHPEDQAISLEYSSRLLSDRPPCVDFEKRYPGKDGTTVWTGFRISVLETAAGLTWHFITHVEDITEQKLARESLRRSELGTAAWWPTCRT